MDRPKLRVEIVAEELVAEVAQLLGGVRYQCSACKHLDKSADSALFNVGEGVAAFKPAVKASAYDIARREAKEVQKALTSLKLKKKLTEEQTAKAWDLADHLIAMLTKMIKNLEEQM